MHIKSFAIIGNGTGRPALQADFCIERPIEFDLDFQLRLRDPETGADVCSMHLRQQGLDIAWLPAGGYRVTVTLGALDLPAGRYACDMLAWSEANRETPALCDSSTLVESLDWKGPAAAVRQPSWQIECTDGSCEIKDLSWNRQHDDWFFRHFDHASRVVIHMMLGDSPLLRGKVLDVGCGDGIIDLAVFLRCRPELLVGIDPFETFERLPGIVADNHLPAGLLDDERLQFYAEDGNDIPYPDNFFDVVLSWGSLEHIAGGYYETLLEIRRVLKPGGLLFVHPGLYYGPVGNHLGEFFDDPYIHLKLSRDELHEKVLSTPPKRMDRSGDTASAEQYWKWYSELNRIRVEAFETQLRGLDFEPWRVALRNADMVEYTPELQAYSFTDLSVSELYLSAVNRKS